MFNNLKKKGDWRDKGVVEQGFTLIELLVVIAILGILAVVGVLSFNGLTDGAKTAVNKTELTQVQTAIDAFQAANDGQWPTGTLALPATGTTALKVDAVGTKGTLVHMDALLKTTKCTYTIAATTGALAQTCP
jgi:prepilin-type N-terminal cleavage/methylation domain-containing protein